MLSEKLYPFFLSILLLFLGVLATGLALGWTTPINYIENFLTGTNERWVLGILGVISVLAGFLLLRNSLRVKAPSQTEVISTTLGKIKITINALENMAAKVAKQIAGVKEVKPIVKCTPTGIAVFLQVNLAPEIHIPDTTTLIQEKIKEYFGKVAGIEVEEVRILVSKLSTESKGRVE
ncbi:MAG: alkaline shock response membrane anchor protein AmaP [Peptococcales bacterium]|jgi:uncharacterized alkaline shock family protein YloU